MIAIAKKCSTESSATSTSVVRTAWHDQFLALLPLIRRQAQGAFRHLDAEARDDAVQGAIAHAYTAFVRLIEQDRGALAYAGPLARFAVARVRADRHVGSCANARDILSGWCQRRQGIRVASLDQQSGEEAGWQEIVVEDRHATPADIAATRIDFEAWLCSLPRRQREIAELLATGEATKLVAHRFGLTPGRVSQIRRRLHSSWCLLQGETAVTPAGAAGR